MVSRDEIRGLLQSCRARLTPEQVGLPAFGGYRRVPGLRREEVAMLVGISVDYYIRIERGDLAGVSDGVLDALVSVLRLSAEEQACLVAVARGDQRGQ